MKSHRPTFGPDIDNQDVFMEAWWSWWNSFNPDWRTRRDGKPVLGGSQSGSWKGLVKRGPSGYALFIITLTWGYPKTPEEDEEILDNWHAALADVSWALESMLSWEKTSTTDLQASTSGANTS